MPIYRRALVLVSGVASAALITTGAAATPAWAQTAARGTAVPGSLALTALSFSQSSVDATSGNATVTLNWTVTDSNPAATDVAGEVDIRLGGPQPFTYVGVTYPAPFDLTGSLTSQVQGNPSGTVGSASFSYTFSVPQYASASTADWVVANVTLQDDQGDNLTLGGSQLARFRAAALTAAELVDSTGPTYDLLQFASGSQRPFVYDNGVSGSVTYTLELLDPQSGFWQGSLTLQGPGGEKERGTFGQVFDQFNQIFTCGGNDNFDLTDSFCNVTVTIPAGAAAGTWTVSTIHLTDNAGNTATYRNLGALPITVTQNEVVTATGFSANPGQVNDWQNVAPSTLSFSVSGAVGGVSAVYVDAGSPDGSTCAFQAGGAAVSGDAVSVPLFVLPRTEFIDPPVHCSITGVAIVDGQGDVAVYGSEYAAPSPGVTITQVPDTPPGLSSVSLSPASVPQSTSAQTVVLKFTTGNNLAAVNLIIATLYDSSGNQVGGAFFDGFLDSNTSNAAQLSIIAGLPPGVYTVGLTMIDYGNLVTKYGPGGQAMPGGPLQLMVTSS
jgi:hypothetical protein